MCCRHVLNPFPNTPFWDGLKFKKVAAPPRWLSGGCEFDHWLRWTFFPACLRRSPLQRHVRKVVGGFGKKSCVSTGVRKPGNTCVSPTAMIWPWLLKWRLSFPTQWHLLMPLGNKPFENTEENEKLLITSNFSFSHSVFYPFLIFLSKLKLSSGNSFSLEESKICHLVLGQTPIQPTNHQRSCRWQLKRRI